MSVWQWSVSSYKRARLCLPVADLCPPETGHSLLQVLPQVSDVLHCPHASRLGILSCRRKFDVIHRYGFDPHTQTEEATSDIRHFTGRLCGDGQGSQRRPSLNPNVDNRKLARWIRLSACTTCRSWMQWFMWKWHFSSGADADMSCHDTTLSVTKLQRKHTLWELPCSSRRPVRKRCQFRHPSSSRCCTEEQERSLLLRCIVKEHCYYT